MNKENIVSLQPVKEHEIAQFKKDLQELFAVAVIEKFGSLGDEPIPSDSDIEQSLNAKGAATYHIVSGRTIVGGVIAVINEETQHNHLDFFFIKKGETSRGLGYKAWMAIEEKYPDTKVWETGTPYFEVRNIHFYVNKCGFKIVKFYNKYLPDPNMIDMPEDEEMPGDDGFFIFEKVMK